MNQQVHVSDEFWPLLNAACDGTLLESQLQELEAVLASDVVARKVFADHFKLKTTIRFLGRAEKIRNLGLAGVRATFAQPLPTCSATPVPAIRLSAFPDTSGFLSSGWPVAYLLATVVCGIGLLIGGLTCVSRPEQLADGENRAGWDKRSDVPPASLHAQHAKPVGQITGAVDCRFAEGPGSDSLRSGIRSLKSPVALGDRFALTSGLLEITYDTGAKIILQGPVRYEVEARDGGYLSIGKLTARVESTASQDPSPKTQDPDPKSETTSKSLNLQTSKFVVRTPTATVTDLGTEFGVEVSKDGNTTSRVFRGSVRLQPFALNDAVPTPAVVLHENESALVQKDARQGAKIRRVRADQCVFIRQLVALPKVIDLLDVVAGGNGLGHCRDRGIDPSTALEDPLFTPGFRRVARNYQRATTYRQNLLDGIFLSDGSQGSVQLDSAGHTFMGFPKAGDESWGSFWARAATVKPADRERAKTEHLFIYSIDHDERFTPGGRGLLCFAPTMGLTFSIEAMRKAYPTVRPARFRAVAGVGDVSAAGKPDEGRGDFWVFVDGQLKLKRMKMGPRDTVVQVDVALGPNDRFLTLVSTDSANEQGCGYVIFGDPVLELVPVAEGRL